MQGIPTPGIPMPESPMPPHDARLQARRPRGRVLALMLAGLLLGRASAAQADACSDCPGPTLADLQAQPGFALEWRPSPLGWPGSSEDYAETNPNGCSFTALGDPHVVQGPAWAVLRGTGEVFNCPQAKSSSEISFTVEEGDSTQWSVQGEVGAELEALGLKLASKVGGGYGRGHAVREVRVHKQTLEAQPGHRVPWEGYFLLATLSLDLDVSVSRNWSWWTKNSATGAEVHRSGTIQMPCGSDHLRLERQASLSAFLHLYDGACGDPAGALTDLGLFPPARVPLTPPAQDLPTLTPGDDEADLPPGDPEQGHDLPNLPPPLRVPAPVPLSPAAPDLPTGPGGEPRPNDAPAQPAGGGDPLPVPDAPPPVGNPPAQEPVAPYPTESKDLGDAPTGPTGDPFPFGAPIRAALPDATAPAEPA